jgi:hypothetical protein
VAVTQVQAALRRIFARWGLPQRLRVDNGAPWATWADLPPAFALWLIGVGIQMIWNRPRSPQENAKVERCNGLIGSWGDPATCADHAQWEARLGEIVVIQREQYVPRRLGQARRAAYPALTAPRREAPAAEPFELERVKQYLAAGRWPRRVSKIGQITFYGKAHRVGRAWAGEQVWLRFDPRTSEWVVEAKEGKELIRHPAEQITTERICGLQVSHPRPPSRKKKRQNQTALP